MGDVPRVLSFLYVLGRNLKVRLCHGTSKADATIHAGIESVRVDTRIADEGDPAVTELNQMSCGYIATSNVIDVRVREGWMAKVDQDNRHASVEQAFHLARGRWHGNDQNPIWPPVQRVPELLIDLLWPTYVVQHDVLAGGREPFLGAVLQQDGGWVGDYRS